jgi:hypothetical protein
VVSARGLGTALALSLAPGCVIYPDSGILESGQRRGFATPEARTALAPGTATRADVLCALGQPDWAAPDGARLVYWTREAQWVFFVYLVFDMAAEISGDDHFLTFEFDAQGRVLAQAEPCKSFEQSLGYGVRPFRPEFYEGLFPAAR